MTRIGVFYDGGWFAHVSDYFAYHHRWRARIALGGLQDAIRWHVHAETGVPLEACLLAEAHYVRGRLVTPSRAFDQVLDDSGIVRHDVPAGRGGQEKGADVYLALEVWERATTSPLDTVALVTGDADLTPLVVRLRSRVVWTLVPVVDAEFTDPQTRTSAALHTAEDLREAANSAPALETLLAAAMEDSYPLRYPFASPATAESTAASAERRRRGTITRWRPGETSGFITDQEGASWFVSRDSLPDGYTELPAGTAVTFSGSPAPAPGKRYPQAYTVRPEPGR